ncbi:NAD(P)H-dependent oxidoreductase [Luteolibacter sp. LG18]|uniref:NAD(P)H-dependent oxidoreductase n=1 Tax=Luteolibacter sp. LG18 TaxID=2819286 RepID=UPI002B29DB99|nr:NAD(P)H-dependent oxidoreductase [Luteolibacter sp. LG18]
MKTATREQLIDQLNWRYATKQFDADRQIDPADWSTLEEALQLSPSSLGLQLWKFVVVEDPEVREQLKAASWGQSQITDASKLVVLAVKKNITEKDIDAHLQRISEVRGVPVEALAPLREMSVGSVILGKDDAARDVWASRQVYIALGNLLTSAALLGIDACPMEGFSPADYDRILGLEEKGLGSVVVAAIGYRSSQDKYAGLPKVRFPKEEVLLHV